jgi:superfamily II DNA or RNA helicase
MPPKLSKLPRGLYDEPITHRLQQSLNEAVAVDIRSNALDDAEAADVLARLVHGLVKRALDAVPVAERPQTQVAVVNELLQVLQRRFPGLELGEDRVELPPRLLESVVDEGTAHPERPLIPPSEAALLVNGRGEPRVGEEIRREIASADRIDLLCSFIKWYGLRVVEEPLLKFLQSGRSLRVLTTTYMAATEARPIEWLVAHGARVKVSYDSDVTRLHAKAWLFHRDTGTSTALVGSSNLSRSALLDGAEWNVRLSKKATPHVVEKFSATFDSYWNDSSFEDHDPERLREALRTSRSTTTIDLAPLDVIARPHQREILEQLTVERERHGRWKNLVVAATGTGKTVVAALDYRELRKRPGFDRLLFVAHRQEILDQTLRVFRTVLRDGSFGELFVDGHRPEEWTHVFASVQSLNKHGVDTIDPSHFDVVIIDEFHHATARTYRALIERLRPKMLLGLTATPERADGESVVDFFDGHIAAELRLWDALAAGLLAPFQYFGVHDDVDLGALKWQRGGYDRAALEQVYTGNDARVVKVIEQLRRRVPDLGRMRALGFCVGVAHARYMAERFNRAGIAALAVWGDADSPDRKHALRQLRDGTIQILFVVDLFNEGVDVPEVDTILFLRPTESATVFLQQLGRGLRRDDDKPCLTVLDFIGTQHANFRFDERYAALLSVPRSAVAQHVEERFPFLPSGCHLELDRVASQIVLDNLKRSIERRDRLVQLLRELGDVDLATFLQATRLDPSQLYRNGRTFTELRRMAGLPAAAAGPREKLVGQALGRVLHIDDVERVARFRDWLSSPTPPSPTTERDRRLLTMLHFVLGGGAAASLDDALDELWQHRALLDELRQLLLLNDRTAATVSSPLPALGDVPLRLHARYARVEVRAAFGRQRVDRPGKHREGVEWVAEHQADVFFVTLQKSERLFSPSTMYRDYAISPSIFHWESQSGTASTSETGRRYIDHAARGSTIHLCVRETTDAPFLYLGTGQYVGHRGDRPMAIEWRLDHPMPESFFREAAVARA